MRIRITCSVCKVDLGRFVMVGREMWLEIGGLRLYTAHGNCSECGAEYHFRAAKKRLEIVTKRARAIEP